MSSSKSFFDVTDEFVGQRVDVYLAKVFKEKSRSNIQKLLESKNVCVNGEAVNKRYKVKSKDAVEVTILDAVKVGFTSQDIPLEVVYEDNDILVVNKEKGMVVHPAPGHPQDTLVNALLFHCGDSLSGINGQIRPGIVHRIDKDTSGLLIVAKHDLA
ncbi:MAG: pseudouridine synthase, partial [Oscillospiraceae bacterium]